MRSLLLFVLFPILLNGCAFNQEQVVEVNSSIRLLCNKGKATIEEYENYYGNFWDLYSLDTGGGSGGGVEISDECGASSCLRLFFFPDVDGRGNRVLDLKSLRKLQAVKSRQLNRKVKLSDFVFVEGLAGYFVCMYPSEGGHSCYFGFNRQPKTKFDSGTEFRILSEFHTQENKFTCKYTSRKQ